MTICEINWHQANWTDLLAITKESHDIWSGGMALADRISYMSRQSSHPWARKHIKRYMLYKNGKRASSCKVFKLSFAFRNQSIDLYGLGGIYTAHEFREQGLAGKLIKEMIDIAKRDEQSGILLFSDIGTDYYERLGFQAFGGNNFEIDLSDLEEKIAASGLSYQIKPLAQSDISDIGCHYQRWLRRADYGRIREADYWSFRIWSERQFQIYSRWEWPVQELVTVSIESQNSPGYAIIECSDLRLRVLEIIACPEKTSMIWDALLAIARTRSLKQIRGWESTSPGQTTSRGAAPIIHNKTRMQERPWAHPMILPMAKQTESWFAGTTCKLLEMDSF
jgi:predicted acetyltransferase